MMIESETNLTKKIAWNGVSFMIPASWEIDGIEKDYLLIGQDTTLKIELKWTRRPKQYSLEKYVKRFMAKSQKLLNIQIHEQKTPPHFIPENPGFDFFFFTWDNRSDSGNGVLAYCNHCKRLTIIRFFNRFKWENAPVMEAVLQSYQDHPELDVCHWDIFGMVFSAPASLTLKKFQFNPGHYQIQLKGRNLLLCVYSWGPASFLLSNTSLEDFAHKHIKLPQEKEKRSNPSNSTRVSMQWEFQNPLFEKLNLPAAISHLMAFTIFNITLHEERNRMIGILVDASKSNAHDVIKRVTVET